jgi:hypothetical protein
LKTARDYVSGFNGLVKLCGPEPENDNQQHHDNQTDHHDSVYGEGSTSEGDYFRIKLENARGTELPIFSPKQAQRT